MRGGRQTNRTIEGRVLAASCRIGLYFRSCPFGDGGRFPKTVIPKFICRQWPRRARKWSGGQDVLV